MKIKTWSRKGNCLQCGVGTGSKHHADCLYAYQLPSDTRRLNPKQQSQEPRVYVLDCAKSTIDFRTEEYKSNFTAIMEEAERLGTVYSLMRFEEDMNDEELDLSNSFIYISHKDQHD